MGKQIANVPSGDRAHVSDVGKGRSTLQEHHEWCSKLWSRIDRGRTGTITRADLDCEEFRQVLQQIITGKQADHTSSNASYGRTQQNVEQCMDFCLRKADFNNDRSLSFEEFKSFLVVLRTSQGAGHTAELIYALFDLDQDGRINREEFKEIYRYYLGHHPSREEFDQEWKRLDAKGKDEVSRADYISWLQTSADPIFRQHAPPLRGYSSDAMSALNKFDKNNLKNTDDTNLMARTLPGLDDMSKAKKHLKPRWNQNFNTRKNMNHEIPSGQRSLFSRTQTLPELTRYFDVHRGFASNAERMKNIPELRRHKGILTTDSVPSLMPERDGHVPYGTMTNAVGKPVGWNDYWHEPLQMKALNKPPPVTLLFRCLGPPPESLIRRCPEDF